MSVYKRKDSRFYTFDFELGGRRFNGSTKATNERDARKAEEAEKLKAKTLIAQLGPAGGKPMTFAAAAQRWWYEHGQHLDPDTEKPWVEWLIARLGRKALHAIGNDDISQLVQERRAHRVKAGHDAKGKQLYRPVSARTVNKTTVSLVRRIVRHAIEHWDVGVPRQPKWQKHFLKEIDRPIREIAASEEAKLDAVEDVDYAELRRFAIITGLRRGEVLVTKPQVDFSNRIIRVVGKGDKPAIVPLSQEAYQILWRRRNDHETHFFTFKAQRTRTCPKTGRQFVKGERYPITYYGFGIHKRRNWKKAGVDARIHDLRHTAGSRTLRTTRNLKLVQLMLRHTDIKTTATFYANVVVDDIRQGMDETAAASALPALPPPKRETQ